MKLKFKIPMQFFAEPAQDPQAEPAQDPQAEPAQDPQAEPETTLIELLDVITKRFDIIEERMTEMENTLSATTAQAQENTQALIDGTGAANTTLNDVVAIESLFDDKGNLI